MTVVVFVCADIAGRLIDSHKAVIQPIFDLMKSRGYNCQWGVWAGNWGFVKDVNESDVTCYVTADTGIPHEPNDCTKSPLQAKTFYHPHGLHPMEKGIVSDIWLGYLSPGEYWLWQKHWICSDKGKTPFISKYALTGWAKFDVLFKPNARNEAVTKFSLENLPHSKTVLYAPTGNWDWATSFDLSALRILQMFEGLPYNLIVKIGEYAESFSTYKSIINYLQNAPKHIRKTDFKEDITPLYSLADVVITDGSSVAWEGVSLDKPTIQLNNMSDPISSQVPGISDCQFCSMANSRGNKYKTYPECRTCGGAIKCSLEELKDTVVKALENPDEYAEERRKWGKIVNHPVDGHAAERCVEAIKKMAGI